MNIRMNYNAKSIGFMSLKMSEKYKWIEFNDNNENLKSMPKSYTMHYYMQLKWSE